MPDIPPGIHWDGDYIGAWIHQQTHPGTWAQLSTEQQQRLTALGSMPVQARSPAPAVPREGKAPSKAQQAFQRGLAALAQWVEQEGSGRPVPRRPDRRDHRRRRDGTGDRKSRRMALWFPVGLRTEAHTASGERRCSGPSNRAMLETALTQDPEVPQRCYRLRTPNEMSAGGR
uniref:helicase associated domain-containing protein n=1 Tax=Streptomyces tabacisoli TaxID=3156398 RepID=UPI003EBC84DD